MAPERTLSMFQSLLQLLILVAILKAGTAMPRNPVCPNTEDKNFPQSVTVNLDILNEKKGRIKDYHNRSTSPWSLRPNKDPERYPPVIWEAECRDLHCVDADRKTNYHLNSVSIEQEILVLRRDSQNCPHSFRLEKMLVKVGCTCVIPIVHHLA